MKILILGAKGNLGVQLTKVFEERHKVIALDKEDVDVTDKKKLLKKIKKIRPHVVINTVAYTAVDESEDNEYYEKAKKINGEAVGDLADICIDLDILFIHYSTNYVFNGKKKEGYKEDDDTSPVNKYGETKLIGEQEILKRSDRGLRWYLIRTSRLFGMGGESGTSKPSFFNLVLNQYAKATTKGEKSIKVVNEEFGNFTYTYDLSEVTKDIIEKELTKDKFDYGIYHISNADSASWYEAALELFKISNIDFEIKSVSSAEYRGKAIRPKYADLLNTKLPQLRSWRDALIEYVKKE